MNAPALRVLSWRGGWAAALLAAVVEPFTAKTGIAVEPVFHVGLRLPTGLTAALQAGTEPFVDVVWSNTAPALRAAARNFCVPLQGLPNLAALGDRARIGIPPDWPLAQAYVVPYVLVYRRALYSAPPRSWEVLARSEHTGRVVFYPGGNGFYPVAQILGGGAVAGIPDQMDPCWTTVRRLRGQLAAPDYSIGLEAPLHAGSIDLLYRALPNALAFAAAGADVGWAVPDEGIADTTDALWIPSGVDPGRMAAARQFIDFALSRDVQEHWCVRMGVVPMHRGAETPAFIRDSPGLPNDADDYSRTLYIPETLKAACEPQWEATFAALTAPGVAGGA